MNSVSLITHWILIYITVSVLSKKDYKLPRTGVTALPISLVSNIPLLKIIYCIRIRTRRRIYARSNITLCLKEFLRAKPEGIP